MAVKIIIKREVPKDKEAELLPLLIELRAKATTQPGYISGETLRNAGNPEEHLIISTWQSKESWENWRASDERTRIHDRILSLLKKEVELGIYYYG